MAIFRECLRRILSDVRGTGGTVAGSAKSDDKGTNFEVERKFAIANDELDSVRSRLSAMGFELARTIDMTDHFLPTKVKGEMLRVRDENIDGRKHTVCTIKEWVTIGNGKERQESEGHLGAVSRCILLVVGRLIGGKPLSTFSKRRLEHQADGPQFSNVVITLDQVDGLGKYSGHYAEVEVLVPQDGNVEEARAAVFRLASQLFGQERDCVEMSYQQMLEASRSQSGR